MGIKMIIKEEKATDIGALTDVTIAAFKNIKISNQTEQFIIKAFRAENAVTISLVAELT